MSEIRKSCEDGNEYTLSEWLAAAGRTDTTSAYDLRRAWAAGESPTIYALGDSDTPEVALIEVRRHRAGKP